MRIGGPNFSPTETISQLVQQLFHQQNGAFKVSLSEPGNFSRIISRNTSRLAPLSYIAAATVSPTFTRRGVWLVQHRTPTMNPEMVSLTTNALSLFAIARLSYCHYCRTHSCVWALVITTYERNEGKFSGARQSEVLLYRSWLHNVIQSYIVRTLETQ